MGSYLSELLLEKNYKVYGMIRRMSTINTTRIDHILDKLILRYGDVTDSGNITNILYEIKNNNPEMERLEIYNLAAQSHKMKRLHFIQEVLMVFQNYLVTG